MITTIALLTARANLSLQQFMDYYENDHVPLILRTAPAPAYYARNYLPPVNERRSPSDFDVITHMKFADEDARQHWLAQILAEGSGVAEDEARFLDRSRTRSWVVDERST